MLIQQHFRGFLSCLKTVWDNRRVKRAPVFRDSALQIRTKETKYSFTLLDCDPADTKLTSVTLSVMMRGQRERVPSTYRDTGARRPAICSLWDTGSRNLPPCSDRSECSDTCGFHPGTRRYLRKHRHNSQDVKSQNTTQQIFQTVLFGENTTVTALLHKHIISDVKQTTTVTFHGSAETEEVWTVSGRHYKTVTAALSQNHW